MGKEGHPIRLRGGPTHGCISTPLYRQHTPRHAGSPRRVYACHSTSTEVSLASNLAPRVRIGRTDRGRWLLSPLHLSFSLKHSHETSPAIVQITPGQPRRVRSTLSPPGLCGGHRPRRQQRQPGAAASGDRRRTPRRRPPARRAREAATRRPQLVQGPPTSRTSPSRLLVHQNNLVRPAVKLLKCRYQG